MKKLLKYLGIGVLAFIVLGVIAVNSGDDNVQSPIHYTIASKDSTDRQITLRITIDNRTDKDSVIEVAELLKQERNWKEKFVCYFDIKVPSHTVAWALVAYLPECNDCNTDKDNSGNPVQFNLIGMDKETANNLRGLSLDSLENKKLEAGFLEDTWKCRTELYTVEGQADQVLMAQLFNKDEKRLQWLTVRDVAGTRRLYFEDDDDKNYVVIDRTAGTVNFYNQEDNLWQSTAIE